MDATAKHKLQSYLQPGERLLWADRPVAWRLLLKQAPVLLFSLFWAAAVAGFFVTLVVKASNGTPAAADQPITLLPFALIPFVLMVVAVVIVIGAGRSIISCWATYYGVTDKRALILTSIWPAKLRSFFALDLGSMERRGQQRRGSIVLQSSNSARRRGSLVDITQSSFVGIANPKRVEALIMTLIDNRTTARTTQ